jgi:membrane protein implicated in regulation of membrane protease activity
VDVFEQWIFFPEIWLILGILLIAADVLIGTAFFALSIGVAALIIAALLFIQDMDGFLYLPKRIFLAGPYPGQQGEQQSILDV